MSGYEGLWGYLVLVLVGFLPADTWRLLGVMIGRGIDEESELLVWVRSVATAVLAGVIAKIAFFPPGSLAAMPLYVRLAAIGCGFLAFLLARRSVFAGLAVGAASEYRNADEGWGIPTMAPFAGDPELSWHLIESLVNEDFDLTTCQEMVVDHAFTLPMALCWPDQKWPVRTVPVVVNTVQAPLPSAKRCYRLGQALGRAIASWPGAERVLVMGTGGLSHQLDGERAGFINKEFDLKFMDSMVTDPAWATKYSATELVELSGTQGVELLNWLVARATLPEKVRKLQANYHIPISNTASGMMVLEAAA